MKKHFDFTEEVRGLQVPTLFVAADADMAPPSHYVEVFNLLDGGLRDGGWMGEGRPKGGHALAILPGPDPLQPRDIAALRDGDAVVPGRARPARGANRCLTQRRDEVEAFVSLPGTSLNTRA